MVKLEAVREVVVRARDQEQVWPGLERGGPSMAAGGGRRRDLGPSGVGESKVDRGFFFFLFFFLGYAA